MHASTHETFDFEDLPMDVFELSAKGLTVESLTTGHGIPENGASSSCSGCVPSCSCPCSCCSS